MLGVILVIVASKRRSTSIQQTERYWLVIGIAALSVLVNLGMALVVGVDSYAVLQRRKE